MALALFKKSNFNAVSSAVPDLPFRVLRRLQLIMTETAVSAARNGIRLGRLSSQISEASRSLSTISKASQELKKAIDDTSQFAIQSSQGAEEVKMLVEANSVKCEEASLSAEAMQKQMQQTEARLTALMEKVQNISEVSKVVEEIALETKLLAFNASIEAARAGEHGHGFKAVAEHIQKLAANTSHQTKQIFELLTAVDQELEPSRSAILESNQLALKTSQQTQEVRESFFQITGLVKEAAESISRIAASSQQQKTSIDEIADSLQAADTTVEAMSQESGEVNAGTFALSEVVEGAYIQFGMIDTETTFHQMLKKARVFAHQCQAVFEGIIDTGQLNLQDVLALEYQEIRGAQIQRLSRLFNVSRVPETGFEPPKYFTRYDELVDLELQNLADQLRDSDKRIVFNLILDLNGYTPTHHKASMQDWTGHREKDIAGNRCKRFFLDNNVLVRGARVGLPPEIVKLPNKSSRQAFEVNAAGALKESLEAKQSYIVQTYARDTGAILTTLTMPIFVKGHRFGAVAIGWSPEA